MLPADLPAEFDSAWRARFRRALRRWYLAHGRELPWRATRDPYAIWVSEIMLQQTTVAAVQPYFDRFLAAFPTVQALAEADEQDVLRLWEGLGYYSRARNLHRAATILTTRYAGEFPREPEQIAELPGIGRYTAGAIASFAFDRPAPIVEANTLRLYCRLMGFSGNPRSAAGQKLLWAFAEMLLPRTKAGDFNQALMELGATVCRIADPGCDNCPVRSCCRAAAEGTQLAIPVPPPRPKITAVTEVAIAVHQAGRWLLRLRRADERWSGMWDFPRFPVEDSVAEQLLKALPPVSRASPKPHQQSLLFADSGAGSTSADELRGRLQKQLTELCGVTAELSGVLGEFQHSVTRYRIRLICLQADGTSALSPPEGETMQWYSANELPDLPLSTSGRRMAKMLAPQ